MSGSVTTRVFDGPIDGDETTNTEDAFTVTVGRTVYVYERWPGGDGRDAYYLASTLRIGDERISETP